MSKLLWLLSLSLYLIAWYLDSRILPRSPPVVNDDLSEFFDPHKLKLPETEVAIAELVRRALSGGQQVRVLGSGHSRNALALSRDITVSLQRFKGVVHLDREAQQVTVRAGTTLWEMVSYLDAHGLALGVLPAILEQTVAGAISTATHGCRTDYGNLAALVTKLRVVTGEGNIITLTANDNNTDFFRAAQVSLGLLGIITEVTFQCEPSFNLEESMEKRSLDACLEDLNDIAHSSEHVKIWLEIYSESCDIYRFDRTEKGVEMNKVFWRNVKMHLWEPLLWLSSWLPSLAPVVIGSSVVYGGVFYPEYTQVEKSFEILTYPLYVPQNTQVEFSVEMRYCVSALQAIKKETYAWKPASIFFEVRFVSPDDIWMSLDYHRQSCHITIIIYNPSAEAKKGYFTSLYEVLRDMGSRPRPHFGKYFNISVKDLTDAYPKYLDFRHVRSKLDPNDVFLNEVLADIF